MADLRKVFLAFRITLFTCLVNLLVLTQSLHHGNAIVKESRRVTNHITANQARRAASHPNDLQTAAGYHHHHDHHGHHHGFGHHGYGDHHHHGHYGDGKYFQYAHNPSYDEYEFGYRRGNDYHFKERYEKYGPAWRFKTKVKWGDKHGGYGERYWDYNHAGHDYDHDHDDHGHHSEPVPSYEAQSSDQKASLVAKRENMRRGHKIIKDSEATSSLTRQAYRHSQLPRKPLLDPNRLVIPIMPQKPSQHLTHPSTYNG